MCDSLGNINQASPLTIDKSLNHNPMEEEPSEYFSEENQEVKPSQMTPQFPPGFEQTDTGVSMPDPLQINLTASMEMEIGIDAEYQEQVGSNSEEARVSSYSPYRTESSRCLFEDELRVCSEEYEGKEELRKQGTAYQSALADPKQAHLFREDEARLAAQALAQQQLQAPLLPIQEAEPPTVPIPNNPPSPIPTINQRPHLRMSARVIEQGEKAQKLYTPKKTRIQKSPHGNKTLKSLDPVRKEEVMRALQKEALGRVPLQQPMVDGINSLCGLDRGVEIGNSSKIKRKLHLDLEQPTSVARLGEDEGESVLGAFDLDSGDDLFDNEDRSNESHWELTYR